MQINGNVLQVKTYGRLTFGYPLSKFTTQNVTILHSEVPIMASIMDTVG